MHPLSSSDTGEEDSMIVLEGPKTVVGHTKEDKIDDWILEFISVIQILMTES